MVKVPDESDTHNEKSYTVVTPIAQALGVRLVDPNTNTELTKASEIVAYLRVSLKGCPLIRFRSRELPGILCTSILASNQARRPQMRTGRGAESQLYLSCE